VCESSWVSTSQHFKSYHIRDASWECNSHQATRTIRSAKRRTTSSVLARLCRKHGNQGRQALQTMISKWKMRLQFFGSLYSTQHATVSHQRTRVKHEIWFHRVRQLMMFKDVRPPFFVQNDVNRFILWKLQFALEKNKKLIQKPDNVAVMGPSQGSRSNKLVQR
jgi:hypothetical protein